MKVLEREEGLVACVHVGCAREQDLLRERKGALIYRIAVILAGPVIARLATECCPISHPSQKIEYTDS
jgi:hypothetical protein